MRGPRRIVAAQTMPTMGRHTRRHILRSSLAIGSLGLLTACGPLQLLTRRRVRRIGFLSALPAPTVSASSFHAFVEGLREHGWVEGENLAIEWRFADGGP